MDDIYVGLTKTGALLETNLANLPKKNKRIYWFSNTEQHLYWNCFLIHKNTGVLFISL